MFVNEGYDGDDVLLLDHVESLWRVYEHTVQHIKHTLGRLLTLQAADQPVQAVRLGKLGTVCTVTSDHGR